MAKAGRKRKAMIPREPNGRGQREPLRATVAQLIRTASMNPRFSSSAGLAFMAHEITEAEYGQAEDVAKIVAAYRAAIQVRNIRTSTGEGGGGGISIDVDSEQGGREAKRHEKAVENFKRMADEIERGVFAAASISASASEAAIARSLGDCRRRAETVLNATIRFSTEVGIIPTEQVELAKIGLRCLCKSRPNRR